MKPHFQCAEQVKPPSNLTKYCACHESLKLQISSETPWSASANRKTIRGYPRIIRRYPRISDDIRRYPRIKSSSRTRRFGDLPDPILVTRFYCKIQHFAVLVTVLKCDLTKLLLDWPSVTLRIYHFTNPSLYESITLRVHHFTNLGLYESITLRIYYFGNLSLYASITLRIYHFTNLLLYESITLRI